MGDRVVSVILLEEAAVDEEAGRDEDEGNGDEMEHPALADETLSVDDGGGLIARDGELDRTGGYSTVGARADVKGGVVGGNAFGVHEKAHFIAALALAGVGVRLAECCPQRGDVDGVGVSCVPCSCKEKQGQKDRPSDET